MEIKLDSEGITPNVKQSILTADESGRATLRITGVASRAQLTALQVEAFNEGLEISELLFVDFTPPPTAALLTTQSVEEEVVGEPVTYDDYLGSLPVATSFDELQSISAPPDAPDVILTEGVTFPDDSGEPIEPVDALIFNSNSPEDSATNSEEPVELTEGGKTLSTAACEDSFVYLYSKVGSTIVRLATGTKVIISSPGSSVTKWVGASGRIDFRFCGPGNLTLYVHAVSSDGLYMHTQAVPFGQTPMIIWEYSRLNTTADDLRADTPQLAADAEPFLSRATQRIWYLMNIVRDWETSTHTLYASHSVDLIFPAQMIGISRAAVGQIWLKGGDFDAPNTIFHEYGHEVYYRRVLGGPAYEHLHREEVAGRGVLPLCIGELSAALWANKDGCTGMLEGFAIRFEAFASRALDAHPTVAPLPTTRFEPEIRPPGVDAGAGVPERVAQHLLDLSDVDTNATSQILRDNDNDPFVRAVTASGDPQLDLRRRYAYVAGLFYDGPSNEGFTWYWRNNFMPVLAPASETTHCATMRFNTLNGVYGCP